MTAKDTLTGRAEMAAEKLAATITGWVIDPMIPTTTKRARCFLASSTAARPTSR